MDLKAGGVGGGGGGKEPAAGVCGGMLFCNILLIRRNYLWISVLEQGIKNVSHGHR